MKKHAEAIWTLFSLIIFPTAFLVSPLISHLGFSQTLDFTYGFISGHTWELVSTIIHIPVGIVAYLMPNDIGYFVSAFLFIFMQAGVFVIYLFFAITIPPEFLASPHSKQPVQSE